LTQDLYFFGFLLKQANYFFGFLRFSAIYFFGYKNTDTPILIKVTTNNKKFNQ